MYVRLAFAVAAHLEPEILIVDEVLAVGDAEFQRRCLGRMEELGKPGRTVLFVSHNMQAVAQLCDRAILLDGGRVVRDGAERGGRRELPPDSRHGAGSDPDVAEDEAPGNDLVRLRRVRVVDAGGQPLDVRRRAPAGRDRARVHRPPTRRAPCCRSSRSRPAGEIAFNAMDIDARWPRPLPPGEYVSTAWIPGT